MRLKLNNDLNKISHSSKNVNYENLSQKNNNFPKITIDSSLLHTTNKSNNKLLNITKINEQNHLKSKITRNTQISSYNPIKKTTNFFHPNYLCTSKQNNNLNKSKLSIPNVYQKSKKSIRDNILFDHTSQCNLKLVQKELQYKLLDMSMQIDNQANSEDEDSNTLSNYEKANMNFWGKNVKNELELTQKEVKENRQRRKSYDINQLYSLNNVYKGFKPTNLAFKKSISMNFANKLSFVNDINNSNIINSTKKRNSVNLKRKSTNLNSFIHNNNKSMYINNNKPKRKRNIYI